MRLLLAVRARQSESKSPGVETWGGDLKDYARKALVGHLANASSSTFLRGAQAAAQPRLFWVCILLEHVHPVVIGRGLTLVKISVRVWLPKKLPPA
jgi:hypothetical protein